MSFNTNYILPGDDKNQIIGKVNYNFSQVLSNAVGLPGQSGILGATGIIGQVGKDGSTGPTGSRANEWYFQQTPPFGNIPYTEAPLINYDVWVDTSPGSTGGPNRIYQYSSTGGNYSLYPFWVDTLSNFAIDGNFTLLQGVSGPGEVTEKNAIVIGATSPSSATFVFTDRDVTAANANPRYSKILIENDASITASLPLFSFGKTFYSVSDLPSFFWQNTGDNYDIKLSSGDEITIQSQATGSYASTGGTASLVASGINWNSSTTASLIGPSGISVNASTIGFSGLNINLQTGGLSLSNMNSGMGATSYGSDYALSINGVLKSPPDQDIGERTVLRYSGFYGGNVRSSLALGVSGGNLFTVGNSPAASQISATYAALAIGYTGSTGVSGGTGANIVKAYQSITSTASSRALFNGFNLNNYIQITPSSDVIVVNAVPTGPISSDGRSGRIWLLLTGIDSYIEAENASCIDIFLNGETCIGGVSVSTNFSFSPSEFYIRDSGATNPGPTGGCRHVRINFFGSAFPTTVNTSGNKFFYIESFSSGYNSSAQLPYYYSSLGGTRLTVICTELYRQGFMTNEIREADEEFGRIISSTSPETMIGYHYWAIPIVGLMKKSSLFSRIVWFVAKPWAYQMAYEMGVIDKGNLAGKILMRFGIFISKSIGKIITLKNPGKLNKLANF
jgi:hypothetical protein